MPIVNFNDTVPAAPSGAINVRWQNDGSANMSAYVPAQSWTTWTPSFSADAGTFTLNNLYLAQYVQVGPLVNFELRFQATTSSASAGFLLITLPTSVVAANNFAATPAAIAEIAPAGVPSMTLCPARVQSTGQVAIGRESLASWPVGSYTFAVSGFYRSA